MKEEKLHVGQSLYFAANVRWISSGDVTVTSIGRKWIHLSNGHRMDKETFRVDGNGYSSPGHCWSSKAEYDAAAERQRLWASIWALVGQERRAPAHLTAEQLLTIESLLKGEPA